jgi:low affinity Fe/Cu permease
MEEVVPAPGCDHRRIAMTDTAGANGGSTKPAQTNLNDRFNGIADGLTNALGSFWALMASVLLVVVWALTGPVFNFSDTWQLFINTTTTVVTFWMVFVIQNSQNRDAKAVHLKLDELIRSVEGARNAFITLERAPEEVMTERANELEKLAEEEGNSGGSVESNASPGGPMDTPDRHGSAG